MHLGFERRRIVERQCGQKPRLISDEELTMASGPSTATASMRNSRRGLKAAPIAFWQRRQWQTR